MNEKIAIYLGWQKCNCVDNEPHYKYGNMNWQSIYVDKMDFHSSWKSLMPVVTKIICEKFEDGENVYLRTFGMINEETGKIMVRFNRHQLFEAYTLLDATYLAVCDYVNTTTPSNTH